jgi:anaerobic ribonucleoside-triphosphate reductase
MDWIDVLSALLTPTIAILGIYIAYQQWRTNKNRLKLELFDKRYEIFTNIKKFIANILTSGIVEQGADIQFLRDTKSVAFLFDEQIANLTNEMYRMATKLQALEKTEKGSIGEKLEKNLDKQDEIKKWFGQQLSDIDNMFKKYLKIEH